jgi:HlyD family secretion protein
MFKRISAWLIGIITLVVIVFIAFQDKPVRVEAFKVKSGPMVVTAAEEGKTRLIERYVISAPIDAFLHRIHFNINDRVQKNQELLTLEPMPSSILDPRSRAQSRAVLGAAQELEKIILEMSKAAEADKALAQITYDRTITLRQKKVVAEDELDIIKAEKRRADAVYRATQFAWIFTGYLTQMSRSALDYEDMRQMLDDNRRFTVLSPAAGTILAINNKSERVVKMGQPLMAIGDISQLEIEAEVLTSVAIKLKPGTSVEIYKTGLDQPLKGQVNYIEPSAFTKISALGVEEQRVKVIIAIEPDYAINLQDGYQVEVRFLLWSSKQCLQIPNSAVFKDEQDKSYVFLIRNNRLQKAQVKLGERNDLMSELLSGLAEDDHIVTFLSNELQEGMQVNF